MPALVENRGDHDGTFDAASWKVCPPESMA
jgi:hypothetical protein